jgi:23S rRNA (adenine1618-N6)-methyltransferase
LLTTSIEDSFPIFLCAAVVKIHTSLHSNNKHRERYNFPELIAVYPSLAPFVFINPYGDSTIDFANPAAVLALNKALLMKFYGIEHWSIPKGFLCPPIPGRAEYIDRVADALGLSLQKTQIHCLDIGVGANCIYPIIGVVDYGWNFVGSDVEEASLKNAQHIIDENPALNNKIALRLQSNRNNIFQGVILTEDRFDLSICNPPFHRSQAEASAGSLRKAKNLGHKKSSSPVLNFGGQANELWCEGGEIHFIQTMIRESVQFKDHCRWFTTLVSKQENLKSAYKELKTVGAGEVNTIEMQLGNKVSRILAWRF